MIYDRIENIGAYLGIHPNLDAAIREIQKGEYAAWPAGRHEIDGNSVFCNRVRIALRDDAPWERHEDYLDIHISLSGGEKIGCAALSQVDGWGAFDPAGDCALAPHARAGVELPLDAGWFLVAFPQDAHMPGLRNGADAGEKAIFKIRWTPNR